MKKTIFNYIQITLALFLFLQAGSVEAQNLTMKAYQTANVGTMNIDGTTLDQVFGTVTINGTVVTGDYNANVNGFANIPTTVSGFGGVQVVYINGYDTTDNITLAQADALIAYVKAGGILVGNIEGFSVSPSNIRASKYIGEALLCNSVTLTASLAQSTGLNPAPAFHPGNGALLLNQGATSIVTSATYSIVTGLPSENIVFKGDNNSTCSATTALEFVIPAYPGSNSNCGVNGMGLFSGEVNGILVKSTNVSRPASNKNYAQLIYDFLYTPSAMATRRAWSTISTNTNTTCAPALLCKAGATAPTLSATTLTASCPTNSMNLNTLVTGNAPTGSVLKWYWDAAHTVEVPNPTTISVSNTFYAFYYDAANDCYSPAASVITTACPLTITNTCPGTATIDLATKVTSPAIPGYTLTFHSGTPATTGNKLTSSVVNTLGTNTYYAAYWLNGSGQDCYTTTSRPMEVTIKQCCAAQTSPDLTN